MVLIKRDSSPGVRFSSGDAPRKRRAFDDTPAASVVLVKRECSSGISPEPHDSRTTPEVQTPTLETFLSRAYMAAHDLNPGFDRDPLDEYIQYLTHLSQQRTEGSASSGGLLRSDGKPSSGVSFTWSAAKECAERMEHKVPQLTRGSSIEVDFAAHRASIVADWESTPQSAAEPSVDGERQDSVPRPFRTSFLDGGDEEVDDALSKSSLAPKTPKGRRWWSRAFGRVWTMPLSVKLFIIIIVSQFVINIVSFMSLVVMQVPRLVEAEYSQQQEVYARAVQAEQAAMSDFLLRLQSAPYAEQLAPRNETWNGTHTAQINQIANESLVRASLVLLVISGFMLYEAITVVRDDPISLFFATLSSFFLTTFNVYVMISDLAATEDSHGMFNFGLDRHSEIVATVVEISLMFLLVPIAIRANKSFGWRVYKKFSAHSAHVQPGDLTRTSRACCASARYASICASA